MPDFVYSIWKDLLCEEWMGDGRGSGRRAGSETWNCYVKFQLNNKKEKRKEKGGGEELKEKQTLSKVEFTSKNTHYSSTLETHCRSETQMIVYQLISIDRCTNILMLFGQYLSIYKILVIKSKLLKNS